jgi:hypothetical protein
VLITNKKGRDIYYSQLFKAKLNVTLLGLYISTLFYSIPPNLRCAFRPEVVIMV